MARYPLLLLAAVVGCSATSPTVPARLLRITNALPSPLAVAIDGTQRIGSVPPDGSAVFSIPEAARTLQYTPTPFSTPSDVVSNVIELAAGDQDIEVNNNTAGGIFYVDLTNVSGGDIDLAIVADGVVRCLGTQGTHTQQQYGYFRLTPTTEFRYYGSTLGCSGGQYVEWTRALIDSLLTPTGELSLRASWRPMAIR